MKINIGCGNKLLPGYVNVDLLSGDAIAIRKSGAAAHGGAPDIIADARKVPLEDGCADEVLAIHLFEHFYRWDAAPFVLYGERVNASTWTALEEWHRLLKPGGILALEMPDIVKCCQNVVKQHSRGESIEDHPLDIDRLKQGTQIGMWGVYGDPRHMDPTMGHRWGWTHGTLKPVVEAMGFILLKEAPTRFHGSGRRKRDFRLEAVKL